MQRYNSSNKKSKEQKAANKQIPTKSGASSLNSPSCRQEFLHSWIHGRALWRNGQTLCEPVAWTQAFSFLLSLVFITYLLVERHSNQRGVFFGECLCLSVELSMKLKGAVYIHTCSEKGEGDVTISRLPNQFPWFTGKIK